MEQEEWGRFSVIRLEPGDQLQTVVHAIDQKPSVLIVLPLQDRMSHGAFVNADDFYALSARERPHHTHVVFVVPEEEEQLQQWARDNGFPVFHSEPDALNSLNFLEKNTPIPPVFMEDGAMSAMERQMAMRADLTSLPELPLTPNPPGARRALKRSLLLLVVLCVITVILVSVFRTSESSSLSVSNSPSTTTNDVGMSDGQVSFMSSGLFDQAGTSGINDQVQISMGHITPSATGKSYYAWLEGDVKQSDTNVLGLGKLTLLGSTARLSYQDPQDRNLLAAFSQVLITQEAKSVVPTMPSLDKSDWWYAGIIPQMPDPNDLKSHYSLLDHLRHLLSDDPTLDQLHLAGGLDVWQYRNIGKLLEWTQSARDSWGNMSATGFIHRQIIRTLDYLDGAAFVYKDVPAGTPLLVDPLQLRVGLVDVSSNEIPASYMTHIGQHLTSLVSCPGVTNAQIQRATQIAGAINIVAGVLEKIRKDAKNLLGMSESQLRGAQAQALLNDMANQSSDAYSGSSNSITGNLQPGSVWIHSQIRLLATFTVSPYTSR